MTNMLNMFLIISTTKKNNEFRSLPYHPYAPDPLFELFRHPEVVPLGVFGAGAEEQRVPVCCAALTGFLPYALGLRGGEEGLIGGGGGGGRLQIEKSCCGAGIRSKYTVFVIHVRFGSAP